MWAQTCCHSISRSISYSKKQLCHWLLHNHFQYYTTQWNIQDEKYNFPFLIKTDHASHINSNEVMSIGCKILQKHLNYAPLSEQRIAFILIR